MTATTTDPLALWRDYPLCQCDKPYAVIITEARGPFEGIARGGRRLCHVCNGRVPIMGRRSHEPPRNSGEGTAVNGPMPLVGESDAEAPV